MLTEKYRRANTLADLLDFEVAALAGAKKWDSQRRVTKFSCDEKSQTRRSTAPNRDFPLRKTVAKQ